MALFSGRSKPLSISGKYFGSHPAIKRQEWLKLVFTESNIQIIGPKNIILHEYPWDKVIGFETVTERQENSNSRITATRLLAVGVLAFGLQKQEGSVSGKIHDALHLTDGDILLELDVTGGAPSGLTGKSAALVLSLHDANATKVRRYVGDHASARNVPVSQNNSVAEQLRDLTELLKDGTITNDEFQEKRKQLLALL